MGYIFCFEKQEGYFEDLLRREAIFNFIDENASGYVGEERKSVIEAKAFEIMKTGIKFKDACHVSAAIYAGCKYFISTDIRLLKYHTDEIKMVNPIAFVIEMEDDGNDNQYD